MLYLRIWEDCYISKTPASEHLRDTEPLLSHWTTCSRPRLRTAQQGTSVSGPDLSLPCSQRSTCPASDALVARLWLWLLPHPSPQDWQLCARDFFYSWFCAADSPFDHMVSLLGCQCPSWCSIHHPTPRDSVSFWFDFPEMKQLVDQFCGSGAQGSFQMGKPEAPPARSQP